MLFLPMRRYIEKPLYLGANSDSCCNDYKNTKLILHNAKRQRDSKGTNKPLLGRPSRQLQSSLGCRTNELYRQAGTLRPRLPHCRLARTGLRELQTKLRQTSKRISITRCMDNSTRHKRNKRVVCCRKRNFRNRRTRQTHQNYRTR